MISFKENEVEEVEVDDFEDLYDYTNEEYFEDEDAQVDDVEEIDYCD